ncbi:ATP-binding cassette domain-containing protein, partial [Vallitalea maricola]|uniref:ATP-binding cassette domain-containing protein n=1 Tax=Vallitalea maricola TaxID=3074433 RepID=UPI0030DD2B55
MEVQGLTKKGNYENINFTMNKGDILGITGLLGSGRTELALSLFGLNKPDSGKIFIDKKEVEICKPENAVKHGIALLPEDRHTQGLFLNQSIKEN